LCLQPHPRLGGRTCPNEAPAAALPLKRRARKGFGKRHGVQAVPVDEDVSDAT
jgi:hypothetical protein